MGSRRSCETLILEGRVRVNGRIAAELGTKVVPDRDKVTCDGKPATPSHDLVYLMLHKPAGVLTSLSDPRERPVIRDLLPARGLPRLFPVGRLDYQTEGLVLLTNDGALAHGLMHPSFEVEKEYLAKVRGCPTPDDLTRLKAGVVSDGERLRATQAEMVRSGLGSAWLKLIVHQGRYHEIRRLCDAIGHPVLELRRVRLGPLVLGKLPKGTWRRLTPVELTGIRRACLGAARRQAAGRSHTPVADSRPKGMKIRTASPASSPRPRGARGERPSSVTPRPAFGGRAQAGRSLRNSARRPKRER
ncbi:Ribosomal large subunit pseudouridine synthase B [Candidatus Methylomirabilis lanthanidiphila]|uniref:Pseudouridine synthase n=1 Tax=Candidatus Methylomirabilis lanthanidiphila TaxID=2211376 RepID=A0A564ZG64_9BACT|nr:Ribosomal large subunit pseudouridine synthase B [Candidatus Methylomirabilis lanthanidiphila]